MRNFCAGSITAMMRMPQPSPSGKRCTFMCFPWRWPEGEGCGIRIVAVIDPHGDLALDILDAIPRSRINEVCYFDVTDTERPVGFNPARNTLWTAP